MYSVNTEGGNPEAKSANQHGNEENMADKEIIIETKDLTKIYGEKTAVDHLNLSIYRGEIFGLLGPNGAGKTTTTLMLTGLTEPTDGSAFINGRDCTRTPMEVKRIVGYMPDNMGFYSDMTGRDNLRFTAALNGMDRKSADEKIERLLERVGMSYAADQKTGTYSKGMKQRLGIADVLIKDPEVIIMDEPTLGIDPEGMRELMNLIRELSEKDGRTILISSHQLYQVQQICDRVGMFVDGHLMACGTIGELAKQMEEERCLLEIVVEPEDEKFLGILKGLEGVMSIGQENNRYLVSAEKDIGNQMAAAAINNGYSLLELRHRGNDLAEIYRRYFEKAGHDDGNNTSNKIKRFISHNR